MENKSDFYKILGIDDNASQSQIRQAYKKLALKYHPDKNPLTEELFKKINQAYKTLSDLKLRSEYDLKKEENPEDIESKNGFNTAIPLHGKTPLSQSYINLMNKYQDEFLSGKKYFSESNIFSNFLESINEISDTSTDLEDINNQDERFENENSKHEDFSCINLDLNEDVNYHFKNSRDNDLYIPSKEEYVTTLEYSLKENDWEGILNFLIFSQHLQEIEKVILKEKNKYNIKSNFSSDEIKKNLIYDFKYTNAIYHNYGYFTNTSNALKNDPKIKLFNIMVLDFKLNIFRENYTAANRIFNEILIVFREEKYLFLIYDLEKKMGKKLTQKKFIVDFDLRNSDEIHFKNKLVLNQRLKALINLETQFPRKDLFDKAINYIDLSISSAILDYSSMANCFLKASEALIKKSTIETCDFYTYGYIMVCNDLLLTAFNIIYEYLDPFNKKYCYDKLLKMLIYLEAEKKLSKIMQDLSTNLIIPQFKKLKDLIPHNLDLVTCYDLLYLNIINLPYLTFKLLNNKKENFFFNYTLFEGKLMNWLRDPQNFSPSSFEDEEKEEFCLSSEYLSKDDLKIECIKHEYDLEYIEKLMNWPILQRDIYGWITGKLVFNTDKIYTNIGGINIDLKTGNFELILIEAKNKEEGLFTSEDIEDIFQRNFISSFFSLDPIEKYKFHPLQKMRYYPDSLKYSNYLFTMMHADYLLKQFSMETDVNAKRPFKTRHFDHPFEFLKKKNLVLEERKQGNSVHRFWIESLPVPYNLVTKQDNTNELSILLGNNEMCVKERLLKYDSNGNMVDDENYNWEVDEDFEDNEDDKNLFEKKFAKNFTRNYDKISEKYPIFARLKMLNKISGLALAFKSIFKNYRETENRASNDFQELKQIYRNYPYYSEIKVEIEVQKLISAQGLDIRNISNLPETYVSIRNQLKDIDNKIKTKIKHFFKEKYYFNDMSDDQANSILLGSNVNAIEEQIKLRFRDHIDFLIKKWSFIDLNLNSFSDLNNMTEEEKSDFKKYFIKYEDKDGISFSDFLGKNPQENKVAEYLPAAFSSENNTIYYGGIFLRTALQPNNSLSSTFSRNSINNSNVLTLSFERLVQDYSLTNLRFSSIENRLNAFRTTYLGQAHNNNNFLNNNSNNNIQFDNNRLSNVGNSTISSHMLRPFVNNNVNLFSNGNLIEYAWRNYYPLRDHSIIEKSAREYKLLGKVENGILNREDILKFIPDNYKSSTNFIQHDSVYRLNSLNINYPKTYMAEGKERVNDAYIKKNCCSWFLHVPCVPQGQPNYSGITIGHGFDIGQVSGRREIKKRENMLVECGIDSNCAEAILRGKGLRGDDAIKYLENTHVEFGGSKVALCNYPIPIDAQRKIFNSFMKMEAEPRYENFLQKNSRINEFINRQTSEVQTKFKAFMIDLHYQYGYIPRLNSNSSLAQNLNSMQSDIINILNNPNDSQNLLMKLKRLTGINNNRTKIREELLKELIDELKRRR